MAEEAVFEVTKDTKISELLARYGDLAEVMSELGIQPVGRLSIRRVIGSFITVETAAKLHKVPLDELLRKVNMAIERVEARRRD